MKYAKLGKSDLNVSRICMGSVSYTHLTGTENLRIFATLRGVPNNHAIKDALDQVGLPYKDKKLFSQYSLGMKQRLAIALAVMHDPELLICLLYTSKRQSGHHAGN